MTDVVEQAREYTPPVEEDRVQQPFDRARVWGSERPKISIGGAVILMIAASVGTRIYLRRRAVSRLRRLAWFVLTVRSLRRAMPRARTTAPLGGASGAALLAAIMVARARRARTEGRLEHLQHRLAALEADAAARLQHEKVRPRDVAFGAVLGLVVASVASRVMGRPSS